MKTSSKTFGLRYWMLRVLEECDKVSTDFSADPVHDLRVALRRCRSMADGMIAMDPDRNWMSMKKAGKQLFQRLGSLRDTQIMMDWIDRLLVEESAPSALPEEPATSGPIAGASDPPPLQATSAPDPARAMLNILRAREAEQKREARAALEAFDRKQWRHWSNSLPRRATRVRLGSAVFKHLALERWTTARQLHTVALRNRSQVSWHTLRIGIKRFRYIVENFLPVEHKAWSNDLKHLQDLLGEVHDLDVLWAAAQSQHVFADDGSRERWHERITQERTRRIDEYRQKTVGPDSLWNLWRAALPQGTQIQEFATRRLKLWAKALDPDFSHSERVARLSLQLYDGLMRAGLFKDVLPENGKGESLRATLYAAALLHDVGKSEGDKGHHKQSQELIKKHGTPLGWNEADMRRASLVARFHAGALPLRNHKVLRDLLPEDQRAVIRLSAVLRLANAFDSAHDGRIRRIKLENVPPPPRRANGFLRKAAPLARNESLIIEAEGYSEGSSTAQAVAAERYLLESVLRRPVMVRPTAIIRQ
ncbi:MAG TPA: CHAD domain-containing protein [Candidatus Sulfotelmatobacter sp.]|nr:CHAD domain-containing protein [Candidatus Sulfotelmatobacter sp.]